MKFLILVISVMILAVNAKFVTFNDAVFGDLDSAVDEIKSIREAKEVLYIPTTIKDCTNPGCDYICKILGFKHGTCVSSTTCRCYS
ncbi:unnamed protein product [Chrysodeixis includens]|uniref:Uncharacterized protein n=1 Tax=Chrysodeixis includens TaxID=689277 RepID=A0A9N8L176_CHRIL|nr:unnamed protein product [Chrysodeixis includens]